MTHGNDKCQNRFVFTNQKLIQIRKIKKKMLWCSVNCFSEENLGSMFRFTQNSDTRISSVHFPSGDVNLCCAQMRWQAAQLWKLSDDLNPISEEKERTAEASAAAILTEFSTQQDIYFFVVILSAVSPCKWVTNPSRTLQKISSPHTHALFAPRIYTRNPRFF